MRVSHLDFSSATWIWISNWYCIQYSLDSHLEQAEIGLDTLSRGFLEKLLRGIARAFGRKTLLGSDKAASKQATLRESALGYQEAVLMAGCDSCAGYRQRRLKWRFFATGSMRETGIWQLLRFAML